MITVPVKASPTRATRAVRLYCRGVGTVRLPWWPDDIAWSRFGGEWEEQPRPGREPLLVRRGLNLPEVRIGAVVSVRDADVIGDVGTLLDRLRRMSRSRNPITFKIASRSGRYRITDPGVTELDWAANGQPSAAEVSLTLKAVSNAALPVGPVRTRR